MEETKKKEKPSSKEGDTVPEQLITLQDYCRAIGSDGINQFAEVRIKTRMNEWDIPDAPKTYLEWEKLYLKVQKS